MNTATDTLSAPAGHAASGEAAHIHLPGPSFWPILLALGMGLVTTGFFFWATGASADWWFGLGAIFCIIPAMGWATTIAAERRHMDPAQTSTDLRRGFLLFLVSESCIFGSFFAHNIYLRFFAPAWPPPGAPVLATQLPAIGTLVLVLSSFTVNIAHHAIKSGKITRAKNWLILTIVMGIVFLGIQAYDWGFLLQFDKFTISKGVFGSGYYLMTGFHGMHVLVGLLMLGLVYWRLERGDYNNPTYSFSTDAAAYYWHFVDIVWIFLFFTIYLLKF